MKYTIIIIIMKYTIIIYCYHFIVITIMIAFRLSLFYLCLHLSPQFNSHIIAHFKEFSRAIISKLSSHPMLLRVLLSLIDFHSKQGLEAPQFLAEVRCTHLFCMHVSYERTDGECTGGSMYGRMYARIRDMYGAMKGYMYVCLLTTSRHSC